MFGPKREVTGRWRKLYNEQLYKLYSSLQLGDQIKDDEMEYTARIDWIQLAQDRVPWALVNAFGYHKKLSLCFNRASRHEGVLGEWWYNSTHSLTSALDGGEWSASLPGGFIPRERVPGTHWIGGWVGPRAVLDAVVKRKIPSPRRKWNPRAPIVQPIAQRYTDCSWGTITVGEFLTQLSNW
jgi:hypothetical protein